MHKAILANLLGYAFGIGHPIAIIASRLAQSVASFGAEAHRIGPDKVPGLVLFCHLKAVPAAYQAVSEPNLCAEGDRLFGCDTSNVEGSVEVARAIGAP